MVIIKPFLFVRFVFGSEILAREKRDERMKGGEEAEVPNDMNKKNIDKMSTANNIYFPCGVWDVSLHKGLHKDNKITSFLTLSPLSLLSLPPPRIKTRVHHERVGLTDSNTSKGLTQLTV